MNLDANNYIVRTTAEIEKLAASVIDADQAATGGRSTFLKAVVATVQAELKAPPRMRSGHSTARLDEATTNLHLEAFQAVYGRFLEAVTKVAKATVPEPDGELMRSRTAFARSAGSTVRGYIRAGNDIRLLAAHRVTKPALAVPVRRRKFTVDALKARASRAAETLESIAKNLHAADREVALDTIRPIIAQLAKLAGITDQATKDTERGIAEGIPIQTRTGVFVPIDLAAMRAARKAA